MRVVEPHDPCDRCGHQMREHASPLLKMQCMVGRSGMRRDSTASLRGWRMCPCDGFVAAPR
jgi:hypothetical protein